MTTKEMIAVMQASEKGKTIQFRKCHLISTDDTWGDTNNPGWDWQHFDYRVKPEPIQIEVWYKKGDIYLTEFCVVLDSKMEADGYTKKVFQEVIE